MTQLYPVQLSPAQQKTFEVLLNLVPTMPVLGISSAAGYGRSTLLHFLHQLLGGELLQSYDLLDYARHHHPLVIENAFEQMVMTAFGDHSVVIVDDLHFLMQVCYNQFNPHAGLINLTLKKLFSYAARNQKTLILAMENHHFRNDVFNQQIRLVTIEEFQSVDYECLCQHYLEPAIARRLDYDKIYRFASNLNAVQLKRACTELLSEPKLDTDQFIEYLRSRQLSSNVDLGEVQAVDLYSLKGVDDVIQSLEANLIIPLENDELAKELDLKPKRGVLLAGPPGTGKTTIGRALAHRLKSKFFLIDGTFIAGTGDFYCNIHQVFEAAKQNAPAIVFIDDSDVIFENGDYTGLYRYLLTLLDGLESESVGRVCVMMTAMNVSSLPPALVRSGRIELWLEMRLPDAAARAAILSGYLSHLPMVLAKADVSQLVAATEGFTGADLKRLIEDGKTLYAYDVIRQNNLRSPTDYFLSAVESVVFNKQKYAEAEAQTQQLMVNGDHQAPDPMMLQHMLAMQQAFSNNMISSNTNGL